MIVKEHVSTSRPVPATPSHQQVINGQYLTGATGSCARPGTLALPDEEDGRRRLAHLPAEYRATSVEVALSQLRLAEASLATGSITLARELLASVRTCVETLDATQVIERVERDRKASIAVSTTPDPSAGLLTARELEVLRLVSEGLTNVEIGERLYISPRTVGGHVRSIFKKVGVTSRTAAAAHAYRHGLL